MTLVLSDIRSSDQCTFHYVEPEDVFAIDFHLKGGSRFDMEGRRFETRPLEVRAGTAPRTSSSSFVLPEHGFRTVAIRFAPETAGELLDRHGLGGSSLMAIVDQASETIATTRLAPLNQAGVAMIEAMFAAPYAGAGRTLFLESCALGLLAAQVEDAGGQQFGSEAALERALTRARDYLDAHLQDPPGIVQLAAIAGMNDFKLKRGFKAAFGTTVFGYVRQRRMERAAGDLHDGLSVAQAAFQAGYECPRCFSDAFRRHFGVLPSAMTKATLAKTPARHG
ncbi:helix-turn-helix transcriptional regulator [Tsuneonella amylolytica]|uniref:helix-turn-helix transcriptional regulator n=1 Tax=Tsuneonella amylolytica TaxID=2338327 RepID=UPI0013C512CB|nr:AraC family transcriptional regulator [Tsuneonella amylolytica]